MAGRRKKSKKRSAASSSPPPDPLTYFTDECLGRAAVVSALRSAGVNVAPFHDHFTTGIKDEELLPQVAAQGWVFVTKDSNIRRRPLEIAALHASKLRVVMVTGGNLRGDELGRLLVFALPRIERTCRKATPPAIIRVTRTGAVDLLDVRSYLRT